MSQEPGDDDLEPEYDFSGAVRAKHYQRYQQETNVVLLDPDVAQAFKDSESVNRALRLRPHGEPCGKPSVHHREEQS